MITSVQTFIYVFSLRSTPGIKKQALDISLLLFFFIFLDLPPLCRVSSLLVQHLDVASVVVYYGTH